MRYYLLLIFLFFASNLKAFQSGFLDRNLKQQPKTVDDLNKKAYNIRLTDPERAIEIGRRSALMSEKLNYNEGFAESNRVIGIGFYYINERDSALNYYLTSLKIFEDIKYELGIARVSNNIGNLWTEVDYDKALEYFKKTLSIAKKHNIKDLIAGAYLNIGNANYRIKNYTLALQNYKKSNQLFSEINNPIGITQSLQNMGVIYYNLGKTDQAENLLIEANKKARENEFNSSIASINMTLCSIAIEKNDFKKAKEYIYEGIGFAKLVNDQKKVYDFTYTNYELEAKRKNYKKALDYLKEINILDSINFKKNTASNFNLIQQTLKQEQTQKENELTIQAQRNAKKLALAIGIVAVLCFFVIFLLVMSNKRSKFSNLELTALNEEVRKQKNNVDRINHKLEELIAERTKDLIIKNQKLSEYSSHLSHQIRGPVATLKGLMMLVEDKLVESHEVAPQIKKCVDDIDEKIMNINDALHDASKSGLS